MDLSIFGWASSRGFGFPRDCSIIALAHAYSAARCARANRTSFPEIAGAARDVRVLHGQHGSPVVHIHHQRDGLSDRSRGGLRARQRLRCLREQGEYHGDSIGHFFLRKNRKYAAAKITA